MVPNLIWAPVFFGPQEVWSLRNLVPKKFEPRMKIITRLFHAGTKFLEGQIPWGPNFLGPKKDSGPNEIGDHFSYSPIIVIGRSNANKYVGMFKVYQALAEKSKCDLMVHTRHMNSEGLI